MRKDLNLLLHHRSYLQTWISGAVLDMSMELLFPVKIPSFHAVETKWFDWFLPRKDQNIYIMIRLPWSSEKAFYAKKLLWEVAGHWFSQNLEGNASLKWEICSLALLFLGVVVQNLAGAQKEQFSFPFWFISFFQVASEIMAEHKQEFENPWV